MLRKSVAGLKLISKVQEKHSPHDIGRFLPKADRLEKNLSLQEDSEANPRLNMKKYKI